MIKKALSYLPAMTLILYGLANMSSEHSFALMHYFGAAPMMLNTAFCFVLLGIALICSAQQSQKARVSQVIAGILVMSIAMIVLSQYLFGIHTGIERLLSLQWMHYSAVAFNQMSLNTSIVLLLGGLTVALLPFAKHHVIGIAIEVCIFLLFLLAILSTFGHLLGMDYLYFWHYYLQMPFASTIACVVLSVGLLITWKTNPLSQTLYENKEDQKVLMLSSGIVFCLILAVVLVSFVSFSDQKIFFSGQTYEESLADRIDMVIIASLIVMLLGIFVLRLAVVPLIKRMMAAEQEIYDTNKKLQDSEERYDLAVRGSRTGLWDWKIGSEYMFYAPYLKQLLGYEDDELPNTVAAFREHIHPDDYPLVEKAIQEHIKLQKPYQIYYRLRNKAGKYRWFYVVGQAIWDKNGKATRIAGSIVDITDRKLEEQCATLQYAVTKILSNVNTLHDAVTPMLREICMSMGWDFGCAWRVDEYENVLKCIDIWHRPEINIEEFEKATRTIRFRLGEGIPGISWEEKSPKWYDDIIADQKLVRMHEAKKANLHNAFCFPILLQNKVLGVMEFFSHEMNPPDKEILKIMSNIGPQLGQFIQRKAIESELLDSEVRNKAILNSALDSIFTLTGKGEIVSSNDQAEKMFHYEGGKLQGKNINDLIPGLSVKIGKIMGKLPVEFVGTCRDGEHIPIELTVSETKLNDQRIFVVVARDISERKRIDILKNEFVSVVSHELRTPLTSIRGSLGLILGGAVLDLEKSKKLLTIANNNCERLLHLINDILDIEKIEAGKMQFSCEYVDINNLAQEAVDANQMYGEKYSIQLRLEKSIQPAYVYVDPDRVMQVLTNLISNAVKFSSNDSSVTIIVKKLDRLAQVSVIDQGAGIPIEFQSRVFEKFSQLDVSNARNIGGTGLGLSVSKVIVEKLGGTLDFISKPGEGSTFYFNFPLKDMASDKKQLIDAQQLKSSEMNILLCEDDDDQASYVQTLLATSGFNVDIASTAADAKRMLIKNNYQALLLDLVLPDQDGITFIREMRENESLKNLPIIVVSVMAGAGHSILNGDAISVVDWLDKPINFSKLLHAIEVVRVNSYVNTPTVLHVEDDENTRQIVTTLLKKEADVTGVASLAEAKIKLVNHHYDLVILDLILPDGNGIELLPVLAKHNIPVVVFSSCELNNDYAYGVREILRKMETPPQKLLDTVRNILNVID